MAKVPAKTKFYTSDLVDYVAEKTERTKTDVKEVIDMIANFFHEKLGKPYYKKNFPSFQWKDIGTFSIKMQGAKKGQTPNGSEYKIPAHPIIKYKVASTLKNSIWEGK